MVLFLTSFLILPVECILFQYYNYCIGTHNFALLKYLMQEEITCHNLFLKSAVRSEAI